MTHSKGKTVHTLHFYIGRPMSRPYRLGVSIAPFNSGTWTVSYDPESQQVSLECSGVETSVQVRSVKMVTWVSYTPDPERYVTDTGLRDAAFPPRPNCRILAKVVLPQVKASKMKMWPATAQMEVELAEVGRGGVASQTVVRTEVASDERVVMRGMAAAASLAHYVPGDVALHFPATDQTLFVNATALEHASPALKDLLDQASESDTASSHGRTESLFSFVGGSDDGSDGGSDSPSREATPMPPSVSATPKPAPRPAPSTIDLESLAPDHRRGTIRDAPYETYQAVIIWLLSGYIDFAPLVASGPIPPITATAAPTAAPSPAGDASSALPSPVLAAAIVQLANTLGLGDLAALALGLYQSQLTVGNVLSQLVRNAHGAEAVKQAIMAFAGQHWEEVKRQPMADELRQPGVLAGTVGGAELGRMLFELASRG